MKNKTKKQAKKPAAKAKAKPAAKKAAGKLSTQRVVNRADKKPKDELSKKLDEINKRLSERSIEKFATDIVYQLDINKVHPGKNYRREIDTNELKELADSIKQVGLIQPISVRPHPEKQGEFEVIAGERRLRAARFAGQKTISALVRLEDNEQSKVLMVVENLQRSDVHPIDEALAYFDLTRKDESTGKKAYTPEALAKVLGKSKSYIFKRMKLRELTQRGIDWFRKNWISYNHALLLSRLEPQVQEAALDWLPLERTKEPGKELFVVSVKTVEQLREFLVMDMAIDMSEAPFDLADDKLLTGVCACSACPKRSINNKELIEGVELDADSRDKCTDKFCFGRKVDAARQNAINKHPEAKTGVMDWSFSKEVKVGGVPLRFSEKKSKEADTPVVVTKQQTGTDKIGHVVYVSLAEKQQKEEAKEKQRVENAANGGQKKWELEQKKRALVSQFRKELRGKFVSDVLTDNYPVPAIADDECINAITERIFNGFDEDSEEAPVGKAIIEKLLRLDAEKAMAMLEEISDKLASTDTDETTLVAVMRENYPDLCNELIKLENVQKAALLRLCLSIYVGGYNVKAHNEPLYMILRAADKKAKPELDEVKYVMDGMNAEEKPEPAPALPAEEAPAKGKGKKKKGVQLLLEDEIAAAEAES